MAKRIEVIINQDALNVFMNKVNLDSYPKSKTMRKGDNVLYVSNYFTTNSAIKEYKTIADAIADFEAGDVICLYPEYFDEDVVLNVPGIHITGFSREKSSINKLTITSKDNCISEITIKDDLTFLCTETYSPRNANQLRNSIVESNVYIGTATSVNHYEVNIDGCWFTGVEKEFVFNGNTGEPISWGTHFIRNSYIRDRIKDNTTIWNPPSSYHLKVYGVCSLHFLYCPFVRFTTITYEGPVVLRFDHCAVFECEGFNFNYDGTALPSGEGHMVINIEYTGFYYGWDKPLHMRYKTEFNVLHSFFFTTGTVITFDSLAGSRWISVIQKVWGSTTYFTGSRLSEYLHIWNSIFHMSAPSEGLATDNGNSWESFIDY